MINKRLSNIGVVLLILLYIVGFVAFQKCESKTKLQQSEEKQQTTKPVDKYDTIVNDNNVLFMKKSDNDWILKYKGTDK
jgi:hypothetical protein